MDSLLPFFLLCFTSFFTLTNPLGTMPVFLTMTNGMSEEQRRAIVRRATIVSFLTLMVFTFSGQFLFKFFGILTNVFCLRAGRRSAYNTGVVKNESTKQGAARRFELGCKNEFRR